MRDEMKYLNAFWERHGEEDVEVWQLERRLREEVNPLAPFKRTPLLSLHAFFPIHSLLLKSKFWPRKSA
jgi:hypothetical protein